MNTYPSLWLKDIGANSASRLSPTTSDATFLFSLAMVRPTHSSTYAFSSLECWASLKWRILTFSLLSTCSEGILRSAFSTTDCSTDMRKLPSAHLISLFLSSWPQVWISCASWVVSSPALTARWTFARECDLFRIVHGAAFPDRTCAWLTRTKVIGCGCVCMSIMQYIMFMYTWYMCVCTYPPSCFHLQDVFWTTRHRASSKWCLKLLLYWHQWWCERLLKNIIDTGVRRDLTSVSSTAAFSMVIVWIQLHDSGTSHRSHRLPSRCKVNMDADLIPVLYSLRWWS